MWEARKPVDPRRRRAPRRFPGSVGLHLTAILFGGALGVAPAAAVTVSGEVAEMESPETPIEEARVTLFTQDLSFFREARADAEGAFTILNVPEGTYSLGASAPGFEYVQLEIEVTPPETVQDVSLGPDVHPGRWSVIGDTDPENLFATDSGTLLPDGRIFYCHDTLDPLVFDPLTGAKFFPSPSPSQQGCHITTLAEDGRLVFIGGQQSDDFRDATKTVKAWDPVADEWDVLQHLNEERWYPGMVRLADGSFLAMGGGQSPNAERTPTCEIYDPGTQQWTPTGEMSLASDFPPSVLLFTGEVLRSWYPPQLYNVDSGQWRDTGLFVQPDRFWPGHCDHSIILLKNGEAMICGIIRGGLESPSMVEIYDPAAEEWRLGASPAVTRSYPEVVQLPTGEVLCAGGKLEDDNPQVPTNEWGQTKLVDLYDPVTDTWRSMEDMFYFREYHALTLLVPDGRVVVTAGTGPPAGPGISNDVEAFEPPYLFRGVRPRIGSISTTDLEHGESFEMTATLTSALTDVVLIGTNAVTHWVDGGVPRLVSLPFTQNGNYYSVEVPNDPVTVPVGWYILFAMVDDVPSEGIVVRVVSAGTSGIGAPAAGPVSVLAAPNPFRSETRVAWRQPSRAHVRFAVYDVTGRVVSSRDLGVLPGGHHDFTWSARDRRGTAFSSGVYWIRLIAGRAETAGKLIIRR